MVTNKTVKLSLFTLILAFIVIGTVAIAGVMKNEKPVEKDRVMETGSIVLSDTYFEFTGAPGEEGDPSKWQETNDPTGCDGYNRACKIKVKSTFLHEVDEQTLINPAMLPTVPTELSEDGVNLVPSSSAAGSSPTQPIVEGEIHNKD